MTAGLASLTNSEFSIKTRIRPAKGKVNMENGAGDHVGSHKKLSALVFGGSGAVGRSLVEQLLADTRYGEVRVAGRRQLGMSGEKLREQVVSMDSDSQLAPLFEGADHVYCCIGTTIKVAGSQAQFRAVDYDMPMRLGRLAKAAGTPRFTVVSAMGANENSRVFYNRVKGEVQRDLAALNLPALDIVQPSLLLVPREESRAGESFGKLAMPLLKPLLQGSLRHYRGIHVRDVATAMIDITHQPSSGVGIHPLGDYA